MTNYQIEVTPQRPDGRYQAYTKGLKPRITHVAKTPELAIEGVSRKLREIQTKEESERAGYASVEDREIKSVHDLAITVYHPVLLTLEPSSLKTYWRDGYKKHIQPSKAYQDKPTDIAFGDFPFAEVRKFHIQNLINGLTREDGTPVGYAVKSKCHQALKALFDEAVDNRIIDFSPVTRIKLGKKPAKIKLKVDEHDIALKLASCPSHMIVPIFLAGGLGMRHGEIIGFEWTKLDRKALQISIDQQKNKSGGYKAPKGGKCAVFNITQDVVDFLDKYGNLDHKFVCTNPRTKKPWSHSAFGRAWTELGLPPLVGPHHLRHLAATNMVKHNLLEAKNVLRHSDLKTTMGYVDETKIDTEGAVHASTNLMQSVVRRLI